MVDRNLVEAVTELKAQYTVSTASAFFFLKRQGAYLSLWERVKAAVPSAQIPFRAFVNLVGDIPRALTVAFEQLKLGSIVAPFLPDPDFAHRARWGGKAPKGIPGEEERLWGLDYPRFLETVIRCMARGDRPEFILRDLASLLADDPVQYFTDASGKRYSFTAARERAARVMQEKETEENAQIVAAAIFRAAMRLNELVTEDEEKYLFNDAAGEYECFERALRELSTHRLEVERRVAIQAFHRFKNLWLERYPHEKSEFARAYAFAVELCGKQLKARAERTERLKALSAPSVIIQNDTRLRDTTRYELLSLKKNRGWLEEVFSR